MAAAKHLVTIKGVKDGLVFQLSDSCDYEALVEELRQKLNRTHRRILEGPPTRVIVKLGRRTVSEQQKSELIALIGSKGNLIVESIESEAPEADGPGGREARMKVLAAIVRSGQTCHHDGDLLILGDVHPGGTVTATGDIYVLGSLRGTAHAGIGGDEQAIIAASHLKPTQLRIANVISRPPDEWDFEEAMMEFAYLNDGRMEIDKIIHLPRVRPGAGGNRRINQGE